MVVPALYYTNTWYAKYLPISSTHSFDNTGQSYDVTRIINDDAAFDLEKYKAYSPLFLSSTFALSYGLSFASITGTNPHLLPRYYTLTNLSFPNHSDLDAHLHLLPQTDLDPGAPLDV